MEGRTPALCKWYFVGILQTALMLNMNNGGGEKSDYASLKMKGRNLMVAITFSPNVCKSLSSIWKEKLRHKIKPHMELAQGHMAWIVLDMAC